MILLETDCCYTLQDWVNLVGIFFIASQDKTTEMPMGVFEVDLSISFLTDPSAAINQVNYGGSFFLYDSHRLWIFTV